MAHIIVAQVRRSVISFTTKGDGMTGRMADEIDGDTSGSLRDDRRARPFCA
jgi:hypothetical protein